jgi:hypothetical protein
MATFRGLSSGVLGASSLGVGVHGFSEFQKGGIKDQTKGVGIGAASVGLAVGAGKLARSSKVANSFDDKMAFATGQAAKQASKSVLRNKLGVGLLAGGVAMGTKAAVDFGQGENKNSMISRHFGGRSSCWWNSIIKVCKVRQR